MLKIILLVFLFSLISCSTTNKEESEIEETRKVYPDGGSIRP
jgi:hypothetical protein